VSPADPLPYVPLPAGGDSWVGVPSLPLAGPLDCAGLELLSVLMLNLPIVCSVIILETTIVDISIETAIEAISKMSIEVVFAIGNFLHRAAHLFF
jgi:hypothetical protein